MVKEVSKIPPTERKPSTTIHLYSVNDPIPIPEAVESNTDTAWGLWEDSIAPPKDAPDTTYDNTMPAELLPEPPEKLPKNRP